MKSHYRSYVPRSSLDMFIVYCGVIYLLGSSVRCIKLSEYITINELQGKQCRGEDAVFNKSAQDPLLCALECFDNEECVGIYFSREVKSCVGCRQFYSDRDLLEDADDNMTAIYDVSSIPLTSPTTATEQMTEDINTTSNSTDLQDDYTSDVVSVPLTSPTTTTEQMTEDLNTTSNSTDLQDDYINTSDVVITPLTSPTTTAEQITEDNNTTSNSTDLQDDYTSDVSSVQFSSPTTATEQITEDINTQNTSTDLQDDFKSDASSPKKTSPTTTTEQMTEDINTTSNLTDLQDDYISGETSTTIAPTPVFTSNLPDQGNDTSDLNRTEKTTKNHESSSSTASLFELWPSNEYPPFGQGYPSDFLADFGITWFQSVSSMRHFVTKSTDINPIIIVIPDSNTHMANPQTASWSSTDDDVFPNHPAPEASTLSGQYDLAPSNEYPPVGQGYWSEFWANYDLNKIHSVSFGQNLRAFCDYLADIGNDAGYSMNGCTDVTSVSDDSSTSDGYPPVGQGYWSQFWEDYGTSVYHSASYAKHFRAYCDYLAEYNEVYYRFLGCFVSSTGSALSSAISYSASM